MKKEQKEEEEDEEKEEGNEEEEEERRRKISSMSQCCKGLLDLHHWLDLLVSSSSFALYNYLDTAARVFRRRFA